MHAHCAPGDGDFMQSLSLFGDLYIDASIAEFF